MNIINFYFNLLFKWAITFF